MTIGVLTFHASINYGSYWQARCLVEGLRGLGHDAVLLDHRCCRVRSRELRNAFQPELPLRTPRRHYPALGRKVRAFEAEVARLPRSAPFPLEAPAEAGRFDTVVVGSDEVWNFSHPWYGGRDIFFGGGLAAGRLVSYAASFGSHAGEWGIDAAWGRKLHAFDAISVRDENSRGIVRGVLGCDPALVLDPCLQFPEVLPAPAAAGRPYALLYGHGLEDWFVAAARRWVDRAGMALVSIGYPHPLADETVADAGPLDFPRLVSGARAVVTTFFHGAVFALHYRRPFVAAASPYRRIKLDGLTRMLGATHRMIDAATCDAAIDRLLATPVEDDVVDRIAAGRQRSAQFLAQSLG